MNELKSYGSKHLYDSLLPCVAGSVSWLVFCSLVSVQSRHFFSSNPWRAKNIDMSQEGDVENEMPLGEEQDNS